MSTQNPVRMEPITPAEQDIYAARQSRKVLATLMQNNSQVSLYVHGENNTQSEFVLPSSAASLLMDALEEIGKGNGVTLIPTDAELTTQQAAEIVRVSRPFFVKILDEGKIPFRMVGAHRRVLYRDVAHYIEEEEARRIKVMEELVAETERLGLYE